MSLILCLKNLITYNNYHRFMLNEEHILHIKKTSIKEILLSGLILLVSIFLPISSSFPQTPNTFVNMTNILFDDFYPMVTVEYESDSIVVLRSDENVILPLNGTLAPLWNAIAIVEKESDFKFKEFSSMELIIDEKLGPTSVFYVIMSK